MGKVSRPTPPSPAAGPAPAAQAEISPELKAGIQKTQKYAQEEGQTKFGAGKIPVYTQAAPQNSKRVAQAAAQSLGRTQNN